MLVFGLTGQARSGKDTLAGYLVDNHGFVRIGLADPLREFVSLVTGLDPDSLMDGSIKEEPLDWLGGKSPRQLMQLLGTEFGRDMIDKDIWLKVAQRRIELAKDRGAAGVVISDVRFDNEAAWVDKMGGHVIRIVRPGAQKVSNHVSESGVDDGWVSKVIYNDSSLTKLALAAPHLLYEYGE